VFLSLIVQTIKTNYFIPVHYTTSCNTQSSAPEDGRDHRPELVELIGIINKLLLLHLVGVFIPYCTENQNKFHVQ
jgi:hypothetical protein